MGTPGTRNEAGGELKARLYRKREARNEYACLGEGRREGTTWAGKGTASEWQGFCLEGLGSRGRGRGGKKERYIRMEERVKVQGYAGQGQGYVWAAVEREAWGVERWFRQETGDASRGSEA